MDNDLQQSIALKRAENAPSVPHGAVLPRTAKPAPRGLLSDCPPLCHAKTPARAELPLSPTWLLRAMRAELPHPVPHRSAAGRADPRAQRGAGAAPALPCASFPFRFTPHLQALARRGVSILQNPSYFSGRQPLAAAGARPRWPCIQIYHFFYACPRARRGVRAEHGKHPSSNRKLPLTQAESRGQFMLSGINTLALPYVFSPERLRRPRIAVSRQVAAPGPRFLPQTHAQALATSRQVNPPLTSFPASSHTERPTLLPVSSKSTIISEATTHRRPGINNSREPLRRAARPNATGVQSPESRSPDCEPSRTLRSAPALLAPQPVGSLPFFHLC